MVDKMSANTILLGILEGTNCVEERDIGGRIILKLILNEWKVLKRGAGEGWRRSVGPIM